ncbi:Oidioi.mRNA.OKI2018_I69.chr2.g5273.t1.cds [Oikopleura dioica]|uniref:Oidioi.mRNA.OKI2018_I69.chr2.g5273.t1.cds n=1 Tax=Oikopleura dioica TaxID=34765 RepID=A0ABN7SZZ3_OIKDI|nr:Oidioi.mRNA.OKI2018_I69.chr2.g5273.t1.cds [Oikopleura dioica]
MASAPKKSKIDVEAKVIEKIRNNDGVWAKCTHPPVVESKCGHNKPKPFFNVRKKECLYYRRDWENHVKNCREVPTISIQDKVANRNCYSSKQLDVITTQQALLTAVTSATLDFWSKSELLPLYKAVICPLGGTEASAEALITDARWIGRKLDELNSELEALFIKKAPILARNGQLTCLIDHQVQNRGPKEECGKYLGIMIVILDILKYEKIPLMIGFEPIETSASLENLDPVRRILEVNYF